MDEAGSFLARLAYDPRHYQIGALACLLVYGFARLDFDIPPAQLAVTLAAVILSQFAFDRAAGRRPSSRAAR